MTQNADIIRGRIEAFEFAAEQFAVYASDHDALKQKGHKTKEQSRPGVLRDCAADLRRYAEEQRKDLAAIEEGR